MDASRRPVSAEPCWADCLAARNAGRARRVAAAGFAARAVGGAVRNALLGRPVVDTHRHPGAAGAGIAAARRGPSVRANRAEHGTITVIASHVPRGTTLREDAETHGRHATVAFTDDWVQTRRRDFTINAPIAADGCVFDPLGAYGDPRRRALMARRVRIREDYLRIRASSGSTAEARRPARQDSRRLRRRAAAGAAVGGAGAPEMLRLLAAARARARPRQQDYGLIGFVLPAAPRPQSFGRLAAIEGELGQAGDAILRLAALAVELPEDADRLRERLRLSNEEHARLLRAALRVPDLSPASDERAAKAYLYADGGTAYRERVLVAWARSGDAPASQAWRERLALTERWQPPRFPLGGADVMALGISAGPRVGELLGALEAWWVAGDFAADAIALRAELQRLVASSQI
jgi:poly(A) polymerase